MLKLPGLQIRQDQFIMFIYIIIKIMNTRNFLIFIIFILVILLGIGIFLAVRDSQVNNPAVNSPQTSNTGSNNNNIDTPTNPVTQFPQGTVSFDSIPSMRRENVPFKTATQSKIPEMELGKRALEILVRTDWTGENDDTLPITVDDFGDEFIEKILQDEKDRGTSLTIPAELEQYYTSAQANTEISELIFDIREEFLMYLEEKGVNQKYIDEINNNALPNDPERLQYKGVNDPDAPPSVTTVFSGQESPTDHSKREFIIYAVDVYNGTRQLADSGILPEDIDPITLRDMGLRVLMYHEFAHVLQKAVDTVNSSEPTSKSSWMNATRSLQKVTDRYDRVWGSEVINDSRNRDVSNESQADGLSFEMITTLYDMSDSQKKLYWEFKFGRLQTALDNWKFIMDTFESTYPDFWVDTFGNKLYKDVFSKADTSIKTPFLRITTRLDAVGPYGGYFQPMRPEHTQEFWDYLKI